MTLTFGLLHTWHPTHAQSVKDYVGFAQAAEDAGFERIWVGDSPLIWQDVYVWLTVLALNTRRVSLGPGVTHPLVRHPAVTASAIGTLNMLSGGRMVVGIGAGDSAHGTMGIKPAEPAVVTEAIRLIKGLHRGEEVPFQDHQLKLVWSRQQIPIYWSTGRRSCLALAGELCEGVILPSPVDADILRRQVAVVREAAAATGRKPSDVKVCLWTNLYVATDEQEIEQARFHTRASANSRLRHSRWWLPPELRERAQRIHAQYRYYEHGNEHAAQYEQTGMDAVELMAIVGTPDQCIAKLRMCEEAGVDELMLGVSQFDNRLELLQRIARDIMPAFR